MRRLFFRSFGLALLVGASHLAACGADGEYVGETERTFDAGPDGRFTASDGGANSDGNAASDASNVDGSTNDGAAIDAGPYTGPKATQLAAGRTRACAITEAGALRCWGGGSSTPETVSPGTTYKRVALGGTNGNDTCAIQSDDSVWCWTVAAPTPVKVDGVSAAELVLGEGHFCAIATNGALYCWGNNTSGQLGLGDYAVHATPTPVGAEADWGQVAAGEKHTCALKKTGALFCWGSASGLSSSSDLSTTSPMEILAGTTFVDLWAVENETVAVRSDGALFRGFGAEPKQSGSITTWSRYRTLSGAGIHSHQCGLYTDGSLYCSGSNWRGQVGVVESKPIPHDATLIGVAGDYSTVAVGYRYSCGLRKDGAVQCWGAASAGQLGNGWPVSPRLTLTQVGTAGEWAFVTANQLRTCAVRKDGTIACWGQGINTLDLPYWDVQTPTAPPAVAGGVATVALGITHSCIKRAGEVLACWGANGFGELGIGASPTVAANPTDVALTPKDFSLGYSHTCAIDANDKLQCWGAPTYNRLGFASASNVSTPTMVGSDSWKAVAATYTNTCAIRADGTLHCFGYSFTGIEQLSADTTWTALATTPNDNEYWGIKGGIPHRWTGNGANHVQYALAGATNWKTITANFEHQCGVRTDGTLVCVGSNTNGELGDGTTTTRATPVQVGSDNDWTSVAAGYSHTCGIRAGGTLYCWGTNNDGEIGDGTAWSAVPQIVSL